MSREQRKVKRAVFEGVWQASRYLLAGGMTALAVATPPLVVVVILAFLGALLVSVLSLLMLASAFLGTADPPFVAFLVAVLLPIGYVIALICLVVAIVATTLIFVGLFVLPLACLAEMLSRSRVQTTWGRIVVFLCAGGAAGLAIAGIWLAVHPPATPVVLGVLSVLLFLASTLSVALFGTILTTAETIRAALAKRRAGARADGNDGADRNTAF